MFAQAGDVAPDAVGRLALREAPLRAVKLQLLLPRSDGPGGVAPQLAENGQRLQRVDIARRGLLCQGAAVIALCRIIVLQLRRQIAERQADEPFVRESLLHLSPAGTRLFHAPLGTQNFPAVERHAVAVVHAGHLDKIVPRLRQAAVRDEVVEQPEVAARVIRVRRDEFAVIGDTPGVIVHAPVAKRAAGRLAELAVGVLLRRADGKRLPGIFRRQRVVLLRLMVVQLGAQAPAAAGAVARLDARLQKALGPLQLGLRQQAAVPDPVLDAIELVVVRQAEQLVERDAKEDGDVRQELDVRRRRARLP